MTEERSYSKAKKLVKSMIDLGYEDLDILIKLGEEFDRDYLESAILPELRKEGLF